jgi:peroxiredoxin
MKQILIVFLLSPLLLLAQKGKREKSKSAPAQATQAQPAKDRFTIEGELPGYPDGTTVDLINNQNGMPEATTQLKEGKFMLTGVQPFPDFKMLSVGKKPPYLVLFLDNSDLKIKWPAGKTPDEAEVSGSTMHAEYVQYNKMAREYDKVFTGETKVDSATAMRISAEMAGFANQHPHAYISLLAIYRQYQLLNDVDVLEAGYKKLDPAIQQSPMGGYIAQQIQEGNRFRIGKPVADFAQADTSGKMIRLSSFKGKYVLVDFWASWCGPCRQENPNVVAAFNRYKNKNFTVFGVSLDKSKDPWIQAIQNDNLTWTHVSDLKGWANEVAKQFGITSIPQNLLIDPNGNLVAKNLRGPALDAKLEALIK